MPRGLTLAAVVALAACDRSPAAPDAGAPASSAVVSAAPPAPVPAPSASEASPTWDLGTWEPVSLVPQCSYAVAPAGKPPPRLAWIACPEGAPPSCRALELPAGVEPEPAGRALGEIGASGPRVVATWKVDADRFVAIVDGEGAVRFALRAGKPPELGGCTPTVLGVAAGVAALQLVDAQLDHSSDPGEPASVLVLTTLGRGGLTPFHKLAPGQWLDQPAFGAQLWGTVVRDDGVFLGPIGQPRKRAAQAHDVQELVIAGKTAAWLDDKPVALGTWRDGPGARRVEAFAQTTWWGLGTDGIDAVMWEKRKGDTQIRALHGKWTAESIDFEPVAIAQSPAGSSSAWAVGAGYAAAIAQGDLLVVKISDGAWMRVPGCKGAKPKAVCFSHETKLLVGRGEVLATADVGEQPGIVRMSIAALGPASPHDATLDGRSGPTLADAGAGDAAADGGASDGGVVHDGGDAGH